MLLANTERGDSLHVCSLPGLKEEVYNLHDCSLFVIARNEGTAFNGAVCS